MTDWNQMGVALMALAFVAQGAHLGSWVWSLKSALRRKNAGMRETRAKVSAWAPTWPAE